MAAWDTTHGHWQVPEQMENRQGCSVMQQGPAVHLGEQGTPAGHRRWGPITFSVPCL